MDKRDPVLLAAAAVNALLAVIAGAFGAHGLEETLDAKHLDIWKTAAQYHLYHGLGMGLCAMAGAGRAGWTMQAGVAVFSGTLYLLAVTGASWLGAITPIGGLVMMVGWALLAIGAWRSRRE